MSVCDVETSPVDMDGALASARNDVPAGNTTAVGCQVKSTGQPVIEVRTRFVLIDVC